MAATDSPVETPLLPAPAASLGRDEQCPLCGGDNQCRVAKGHLYKGPCWCHEVVVPGHVLSRLTEDRLEPACLCRPCLETVANLSSEIDDTSTLLQKIDHAIASRRVPLAEDDFYLDENGNTVFTAAYHLKRGHCCANACRHCPY
jgi:hypothetical protein